MAAAAPPPSPPPDAAASLIDGAFAVDLAHPLPGAGGGVAAFAAQDRPGGRRDLMALAVPPGLPPRAGALAGLAAPVEGLLAPLAHGPGPRAGGRPGELSPYVVCPAPPGPALGVGLAPWPEAALLDLVLRPAAHVLQDLAGRGLTHRAIRPDNVFQAAPGRPAVLGAAWAAPAAMHQPAANEPPYVAMCLPAGRGEGSIADDVYAVGVLLLTLATGTPPLAGLDAAGVIRRKLDLGSFAALAGEARLPPRLAELLQAMLADDPEHRPPPAVLADPARARTRRVVTRPAAQARQPLRIGAVAASGARSLAYALAAAPESGLRALRSGAVEQWLRRDLGDTALSQRLAETLRQRGAADLRGEPLLLVRAAAALDPLAPLCWPGAVVWPDGVGPALAAARAAAASTEGPGPEAAGPQAPTAGSADLPRLLGLIRAEAVGAWAEARSGRSDPLPYRAGARQWRGWLQTQGPGGGTGRLVYALNPLLPCASPRLAGRAVTALAALPAALEAVAPPAPQADDGPVDPEIMAFVAARQDPGSGPPAEVAAPAPPAGGPTAVPALAQMEILARLQARYHKAPLPGLARWLAATAAPLTGAWHHLGRRAEIAARLAALAEAGTIAPMLDLLRDPSAWQADERGFLAATQEVAQIDAALDGLATGGPGRAALARQWGQELAAGIGLAALAAVLGMAALG